ncbi:MAG TPA: hypothetical protein ENK07_01370 [Bacteroidetes bacterium]|nr:hypothetical protein [Bacteroidota bacterium]
MGLLMPGNVSPLPKSPLRRFRFFLPGLVGLFLLFLGCQPFVAPPELVREPPLWTQLGGDPGRTNVAKEGVRPELERVWDKRMPGGVGPAFLVRGTMVAVPTMKGETRFLDLRTGKKRGKIKYGKNAVTGVWPNDSVYVVVGRIEHRSVGAYNLRRGKWLWRRALGLVDSEPLTWDDRVLVCSTYGKVTLLDVATGKILWQKRLKGQIRSSPAALDSLVFVATDRGQVVALDRKSGTVVWKKKLGTAVVAPLAARDSLLFVGTWDSTLYAVRAADGSEVWHFEAGGRFYQGFAATEERLLAATADHVVHCFAKADGRVLWETTLPAPAGTAPLVSGDVVWLGGLDRHLYALKLATGERLWDTTLRGRVRTWPVVTNGWLYVASEEYRVYSFRPKRGSLR